MTRRIAHVVSSLKIGGMEQFVVRLAAHQKAAGHDVAIVALEGGGPLREEALRRDIMLRELTGASRALRVLQAIATFARLRPDIVHGHNMTSLHYCALAKRCTQARIVLTCHGRGKPGTREPRPEEWTGLHAVAAVSGAVADEVAQYVSPERLHVVHNGVDEPYQPACRRSEARKELFLTDEFVGIIVARIDHLKGHETLLRACRRILSRQPRFTLLVAGDGTERAAMEVLSEQLLLGERVRFLGQRSDVGDLLAASDLFILPSLTEGLPLSVLEAMSHGLPVVATHVGGIPELVTNNEHGLLVPVRDAEQLGDAILRVAEDPELARRLGAAGRDRALAEFSFAAMAAKYDDLYGGPAGCSRAA